MSIQDILSSPESKNLEFKEAMPSPLSIAKTTCAFANGGGGSQWEANEMIVKVYEKIVQLKLPSPDGKYYNTDCANTESMFRIIHSIAQGGAAQTLAGTGGQRAH